MDNVQIGKPYLIIFILYLAANLFNLTAECQFIVHFNSQGLIGNITFDSNPSNNELTIESIIEDIIPSRRNSSIIEPLLFDWKVHTNQLSSISAIQSCKTDDLGNAISDKETKSSLLADNKFIALNKLNSWKVKLDSFLQNNDVKNLGSLIWGKSIVLTFLKQPGLSLGPPETGSNYGKNSFSKPSLSTSTSNTDDSGSTTNVKPLPKTPSLRVPQLTLVPTTPASASPKPAHFAPRPKPQISGRFKLQTSSVSTPAPLPKAEALVMSVEGESDVKLKSHMSDNNTTLERPIKLPSINQTVSQNDVASPEAVAPAVDSVASAAAAAAAAKASTLAAQKQAQKLYGSIRLCGNILDTRDVKTVEASFDTSLAGKVIIRGNEDDTTLIMANVYHTKSRVSTRHDWKILASDILDDQNHLEKCKHLHILFDPNNLQDNECSRSDTRKCRMGDLTRKFGQLQVAGQGRSSKLSFVDMNLPLSALAGSRSLYLVIYDVSLTTSSTSGSSLPTNNGLIRSQILSCAKINPVEARIAEAQFSMDGVRGSIRMQQRYSLEPTLISYDLYGLEGNMKHIELRNLPLPSRKTSDNLGMCKSLGPIYDPLKVGPGPGGDSGADHAKSSNFFNTIDKYPIGALSSKLGELAVLDAEYEDHYKGEFYDLSLQLFGPQTVIGRSIVINKNNDEPWVCANLDYANNEKLAFAAATFYYPVVGRILFHQFADEPHSETGVLIDVYNPNQLDGASGSDGSNQHNWLIHLHESGADFYNWSERCQSAGPIFDPLQVGPTSSSTTSGPASSSNETNYARQCQTSLQQLEPLRCRSGDTALKSSIKLSLPQSLQNKTRFYYTDPYLPLSGPNSILGKSVVIYDETAPVQRGNRLACSTIKSIHPLKASVKSWTSGPSIPSAVKGSINFEQYLETMPTHVKFDLSGFNGNVENYGIHQVWTVDDKEFPCSNDSLYDIFDPYDTEHSLKLPPSAHYGSLATDDRVKVGDLSRKYGTFEGQQGVTKTVSDLNAPLFAPKSIIGRSVILRASVNDFRWVCGNVELDYDRTKSREIIGLASFDEPRSKVSGYVRFFQLEHKDGSTSDTFVHIDLKLQTDTNGGNMMQELGPGQGYNWAIFVNQVGEDAYIAADEVRCIAAGFKWNPYLAQDSSESYPSSCNPASGIHQACAMGDLGMRHGALTLGPNNRRTISDSNLPLTGNYSIMGRSLVIFDAKKPGTKLACANIFPDQHLKSNVVIKRTPSFTVARFVEQMRSLLDAAEWLMVPDLKATKSIANGECVQMTIHFYGQKAYQMQSELNNLVTLGTVRRSNKFGISEKMTTHFKLCRLSENTANLRGSSPGQINNLNTFLLTTLVIINLYIHISTFNFDC